MALPQQVVDRLAQETPKTQGWSVELFSLAVAIFVISIVIYGGIVFGYQPYTAHQVKQLDDQIASFQQQIPLHDQRQIATFYSQLINLKTVLGSRGSLVPLFGWLEQHTETNVSFSLASVDVTRNQLALTGVAKSFDDVGREARIFEQDPNVANVFVGSIINGSSGGWQFTLTITFVSGFFKVAPAPLPTP